MENIAFAAFTATGSALCIVLWWLGTNTIKNQKDLADKMERGFERVNDSFTQINTTLASIERDIREELKDLDSRLSRLEGKINQ